MNSRCNILPHPGFAELNATLVERLAKISEMVEPDNLASFLDPLMREVIQQGFNEAGAHEGTVWLLDRAGEHLVPAYNTGQNAAAIVGKFRQPLNAGLICMVLASEQPFLENEVYKNAQQSKLLDRSLEVQTYALIAVPFYLLKRCAGVISCVQLQPRGKPDKTLRGFTPRDLAAVQRAACVLTRLLEYRLLSCTVDWNPD